MYLNDYEFDIVCSIQASYAETIYKIYADFTHNSDNRYLDRQRTFLHREKYFRYIQIRYDTLENRKECDVSFISPIPLTLEMRNELHKQIIKTNEEYLKGFRKFLSLTFERWFEPLQMVSVNQILHITIPIHISDDLKTVSFRFSHLKHYKGYYPGWKNITFYQYLFKNKHFLEYLRILREDQIKYYENELKELKEKFSFYLEYHEFHDIQGKINWIENHLRLLYNNRYFYYPTSYTSDDDYTINKLIDDGFPVNRKNDFLFQLFGDT